ncbi:AraC family transcriptional regulator, partial [Burkholderia glumae]
MSFEPLIPDGDLRVQRRMIELIDRLAPNNGSTDAALEGVRFLRVGARVPRCPVLYEPSIVIVCQGRKVGYVGERTFVYDERQYLVLSVPLPFE